MTQRTTRNGWTNRIISIGLLMSLAACATGGAADQQSGKPGVNIADAALDGGMPETALNVTRTILLSDPHNVDALERQGIALTQLNQPDAAIEAYQRGAGGGSGGAHRAARPRPAAAGAWQCR